ncbi:integrator complex subunit 12-like [Macrobrachium nipponense]|uniref:integrator complex subunit 12-like n=1 Tax=Macrobrachium nipponense TaxID=159736 RepID=UPI0030C85B74
MASLELDPMFRRGLRLLHSRSRESVNQLKAIVDEAVRQRQGKSIPTMNKDPFSLRRESPIPRSKPGSPIPLSLSRKEEMKKDMDRKHGMRDEDIILPKRPRLDSPSTFKSHTPSPTPSLKSESSSRSRKSDESDSDPEMNDLRELMDGVNCTVCKSFEQSTRNQLVECQECHCLYHQECHKPPVTDQDVTDPRLAWYCNKCTKTLKKQNSIVSASGGNGGSSRGVPSGGITGISNTNKSGSISRPTPSPTKGLGMARPSPFANLSSASGRNVGSGNSNSGNNGNKPSLSSSSSSSCSKSTAPSNSMISAEKRMQLMKKKAAAKMAEKRKM